MPPTPARTRNALVAPTPPKPLSLDERLALINTEMTLRLDEAAVAHEVNTAHISTEHVNLADTVTVPLTPTLQPPPTPYPTPVAALLQRAHHRLLTGGWCAGAYQDEDGALCLFGAIRVESRRDLGLEMNAVAVVMDAIRRQFGDRYDSVPSFNDSFKGTDGRVPVRTLGQAADLADTRGL
ncbi:DUF6197 family protein [Streptomyces sp. NPDC001493]